MSARHITVTGRVQGVGFRYACCRRAQLLGLAGWVRNACDGSVEIYAEGGDDALDDLLAWCHDGPPGAHVNEVRTSSAVVPKPTGGAITF